MLIVALPLTLVAKMTERFGRNLRRLMEEYATDGLDAEGGNSQPYRGFSRLSISPEGAVSIDTEAPTEADTVQAAREAVRMLKKRGYRANDQVKAAEAAATAKADELEKRHPEPTYLDGGDPIEQFMRDYVAHTKGS
jgi:hypothetical protein